MSRIEVLEKRRDMLKEQICNNLDLLVGSVGKSPAMRHHNLTTKVDGKTVTKYVRNGHVTKVKKMILRYDKVYTLILKLSKVNWELLKLKS